MANGQDTSTSTGNIDDRSRINSVKLILERMFNNQTNIARISTFAYIPNNNLAIEYIINKNCAQKKGNQSIELLPAAFDMYREILQFESTEKQTILIEHQKNFNYFLMLATLILALNGVSSIFVSLSKGDYDFIPTHPVFSCLAGATLGIIILITCYLLIIIFNYKKKI